MHPIKMELYTAGRRCGQRSWPRILVVASLLAVLCGCPARTPPPPKPGAMGGQQRPSAAAALAERVCAAYADAAGYTDNGQLRWQYRSGDAWQEATAEFSTTLVRPNRMALHWRGLHLACDGTSLQAVIEDEATDNYDGQMLFRQAPGQVTMGDLYSDSEIARLLDDPIIDGTPWPLRLLLKDARLADALGNAEELPKKTIDGKTYRRLKVAVEGGDAVAWIDPQTLLLRRVELPQPATELAIRAPVAEFADARVGEKLAVDEAKFTLPVPPGVKKVHFFVPPPATFDLPSPLFGRTVGDFRFTSADGEPVTREAFAGTISVLIWFLDRPESHITLRQLQEVQRRYAEEDDVRFFAISPLPEQVSDAHVRESLEKIGVTLPLLRDTRAAGRDVFDVLGAPTVVVLDGQLRVQAFKTGVDPQLEQQLPALLDELLAGKNPAGELRRMVAEEVAGYRRQLAAARTDAAATVIELPETPITAARDPEKLKLTRLWTAAGVKSPRNILVIAGEAADPAILVHDQTVDWRTIVELNAKGEIVARRQLPVPKSAAIAMLRTAVDGDGRRWYAGGARLAQQVYLFDERWQLAATYPADAARHDGVSDFTLIDFQGDGKLQLCVGFWGVLGVHGANLQGTRQWTNRAVAPAISLANSLPNEAGWRQLLATTDRGEIVPINGFGHNDKPQRLEHSAITQLIAARFPPTDRAAFMGVSVTPDGTSIGTALSADLQPLWDVPLPAGTHRNQILWITSGRLLPGDVGQWVFAGPDGSIGIVSNDMSFFDAFYTGQQLTGVAVAQLGSDRVLLVASDEELTAWKVEKP